MKRMKVVLCLCLASCLVTFVGCATCQPMKPRVMLHPMEYQNSVNFEGMSVSGAAQGGVALQMQMERQIRLTLARDHLKPMTLSPGVRYDGIILCPAVDLQAVQILLENPGYQWSQPIEVPVKAEPGFGPKP